MKLGERSPGLPFRAPRSAPPLSLAFRQTLPQRVDYPFPQAVLDKSDSLPSEASTGEKAAKAVCGPDLSRQGRGGAGPGVTPAASSLNPPPSPVTGI